MSISKGANLNFSKVAWQAGANLLFLGTLRCCEAGVVETAAAAAAASGAFKQGAHQVSKIH